MAVDGIIRTDGLTGQYQCRRKMSKQIAEELGQEDEVRLYFFILFSFM